MKAFWTERLRLALATGLGATMLFSVMTYQLSGPENLGLKAAIYFVGFAAFCYLVLFRGK